jgi:hypothetical protein
MKPQKKYKLSKELKMKPRNTLSLNECKKYKLPGISSKLKFLE